MGEQWDVRVVLEGSVAQRVNVACLTLCLYDYACTLSDEVAFIWRAPWNIPKFLYFVARYSPLIILPVFVYLHQFQCQSYQVFLPWPGKVCVCVCELIFALRTWAVWDRSRGISIFLLTFFPGLWVTVFVLLALSGLRQPDPTFPNLCEFGSAKPRMGGLQSSSLLIDFCLVLLFYCVIIVLTSVKAYQHCIKSPGTSLTRIVHLDGILYYICCLSFAVAIIFFLTTTSISAPDVIASMLLVLHLTITSVLSCRLLLRLREHGSHTMRGLGSSQYSSSFTLQLDTLAFGHDDLDLEH